MIYIRELFPRLTAKVLSYMDDISLTVASTSLKKNIRILEREAAKIYELGAKNAIQFDLAETELIHFSTGKDAKRPILNYLMRKLYAQRSSQMARDIFRQRTHIQATRLD